MADFTIIGEKLSVGLSTDTKISSGLPSGHRAYELDTGDFFTTIDGGTTYYRDHNVGEIQRKVFDAVIATIGNGANDSDEIDLGGSSMAMMYVPSGFEGTEVTFKTVHTAAGTGYVIADENDSIITMTVQATRCYPVPSEVMQARRVIVVAGTAQTGPAEIIIIPKG